MDEGAVQLTLMSASLWDTMANEVGAPGLVAEISDVSAERGDVPTTFTDLMANL
jgi:hypothetical protein